MSAVSKRSGWSSASSATTSATPMDRLLEGSSGRITALDVAQSDLQRLEVMGICPGRLVHIVRQGDPMIVRVLGTRIGLAAAVATFVYVTPCESC